MQTLATLMQLAYLKSVIGGITGVTIAVFVVVLASKKRGDRK
jgi:hypothetical protein